MGKLLFIVAMYSTIAIVNGSRTKQEEMPNLVGVEGVGTLTKDEAIKVLNDLGFENIIIEEEYSDDIEKGYVISQNPAAQENFKINVTQEIKLVISKGQKIVTLPKKMIGKKYEDVATELDKLELKYEKKEEFDEKVEAGYVLEVDPEEGEEITAATVVQIKVSKGSEFKDVTVPSVINSTESDAQNTLKSIGLSVKVAYEENSSKSDGVVISQSVTPNSTVKEGETITIVVNKQPKKSTLTVKVNLKALMNYTEPKPIETTTIDEFENEVTTVEVPEIDKATVVIEVGEDTILSDTYPMTKTDISKSWTASDVKELKVKVNGVTKFHQQIDFNKGDQTVTVDSSN